MKSHKSMKISFYPDSFGSTDKGSIVKNDREITFSFQGNFYDE